LVVALAACTGEDPVAPAASASRPSIRIEGPGTITEAGTYSWTAITDDGHDDYEFYWQVSWLDSSDPPFEATGRVLTLDVDPLRGDISLQLKAVADGGGTYLAGQVVSTCGGPPFDDERIIKECNH
jgi:hypothetical protein